MWEMAEKNNLLYVRWQPSKKGDEKRKSIDLTSSNRTKMRALG